MYSSTKLNCILSFKVLSVVPSRILKKKKKEKQLEKWHEM